MMAPILFINVAFSIVLAEGLLRGTRSNIGLEMETQAQSSLASFVNKQSLSSLIKGTRGPVSDEGLAGIIRDGVAKIDPNEAAFSLLSDGKAFPEGPPEELRKVLHHMAKKHRSKMRKAKKGMVLKQAPVTSTSINDATAAQPSLTASDDDIKKAVKTCNDMAYNAGASLDIELVRCWEQGNASRDQQWQVYADIDRLHEEVSVLYTKNIRIKTKKEGAEEELAAVKASNTSETVKYNEDYKSMSDEMGKLKSELATSKFMLNITKCPASELPADFLQTNPKKSSSTGNKKIELCQSSGDGTTKYAFIDPRLESGNKRLSLQGQQRLAVALSGLAVGPSGEKLDDGDDDDDADESGPLEDEDQDQGIALIQKSDTGRRTGQKIPYYMECTGPCGGGDRCMKLESDSAYLYDTFALIWGEVKDQVEKLQEEMDERTVEYEKLTSFYNREAEVLSKEISSCDEEFLDAESQKISIWSKLHIKYGEWHSLQDSYNELCEQCEETCSYIVGTLICGPLAVKTELIKNLDTATENDPMNVGDCETTMLVAGKCSVECDDKLVGGVTTMSRRIYSDQDGDLGMKCPALSLSMKCGQKKCPVDCEVDDWGDWSECTRECGGGATTRTRAVSVHPANGGSGCPPLTDAQQCNDDTACDVDCGLLEWTDWSPCSAACGGGAQARFRDEDPAKPAKGLNGKCPDYYDAKRYKNQSCNDEPCKGDEICIAKMDVVMLIDSSGSMSEKGFGILKNLSEKILERLNSTSYGNEAVRVGVVQFGNGHLSAQDVVTPAKLVKTFSTNFADVKTSIKAMVYQKGFTNMAQALIKAKDLLTKKGRATAAGTVIMITDGFPSFQFETEQAAQRLRKSANLVIAHVKSNPTSYDSALMMKLARYSGNYLNIPGKQKLKEDMQTYAGQAVTRMCSEAESISVVAEKNKVRGFRKKLQGWWCWNPMPVKWYSGWSGYGWANSMSKETCKAKAEAESAAWTIFEYTWYPGSTFHECLVYTQECISWSPWWHANIYEQYHAPAVITQEPLSSIGPDAEFDPSR